MERIFGKLSESVGKGSGIVVKARGKKGGEGWVVEGKIERGEGWVGEGKKERRERWVREGKKKREGRGGWVGDEVIEKIKN